MSADAVDTDRVDPYSAVIEGDGSPRAPRLSTAWAGICEVMADGKPHDLSELIEASHGLAENTVRQLLSAAVDALRVQVITDGRAVRRGTGRIARRYRLTP